MAVVVWRVKLALERPLWKCQVQIPAALLPIKLPAHVNPGRPQGKAQALDSGSYGKDWIQFEASGLDSPGGTVVRIRRLNHQMGERSFSVSHHFAI